jgi:type VI secretion system protein ImpC
LNHDLDRTSLTHGASRISFESRLDGARYVQEIPFVIGILADLAGSPAEPHAPLGDRRFLEVSPETLGTVLNASNARLAFRVENRLQRDGSELCVEVRFKDLDDFEPPGVAVEVEPLRALLAVRGRLAELVRQVKGNRRLGELLESILEREDAFRGVQSELNEERARVADVQGWTAEPPATEHLRVKADVVVYEGNGTPGLLEEIVRETRLSAHGEGQRERAIGLLESFVSELVSGEHRFGRIAQPVKHIEQQLSRIDALVSDQVDRIIHHPEFQALHATWLGIRDLVESARSQLRVQVHVMHARKRDLLEDMEWSDSHEGSELYRKVYRERFDTLGAAPFAVLVGDYRFTSSPEDVEMLRWISRVVASSHTTFLAAASSALFGHEGWSFLSRAEKLADRFKALAYCKWMSFRATAESRFVGLCLPPVLMRAPYNGSEQESFRYIETVDAELKSDILFGNPAYRLASCLARQTHASGGKFVLGVENGGYVPALPVSATPGGAGSRPAIGPCEARVSGEREYELGRLGFIPAVHHTATDGLAFRIGAMCHAAEPSGRPTGPLPVVQLTHVLTVARFAHYLKAILESKRGGVARGPELRAILQDWLRGYTVCVDPGANDAGTWHPLLSAQVEVEEDADFPGRFRVLAELVPNSSCVAPCVARVNIA